MSTKSEDIRLQINEVKYKKGDGTLYLMAERLGWMPNTKNNFAISHKYSDIKMQKISPEIKVKIQLQIVLHTGDSTTFQFNNLEDRTAVKDALLQILPQFKGKIPKERERKALLLDRNPHLLQIYKDLVETKIVSAEEFWSQFTDEKNSTAEIQVEQQECGVSANFLSGIPLNGKQITGQVTAETLYAILKTYPKVAKRHEEMVPTKMTETEFWNKFFQSRYFNRDRTKDLFSDCAKSDEKEYFSSVQSGSIDLDMLDDNAYHFTGDEPSTSSHDNLISRVNQLSTRLLKSMKTQDVLITPTGERDMVELDSGVSLSNTQNYTAVGPIDRRNYTAVPKDQSQGALNPRMVEVHSEAIKGWEPELTCCLAAKDATEALKNLSPAGYLMRSSNSNRLVDTVPEELQKKLRDTYLASNELLRHFWLCFPAVEPSLETRLVKIHDTIKKFESNKIQPFYDSLPREHKQLLDHLMRGQFKKASRKFEDWKNKKRQRETTMSRGAASVRQQTS